MQKQWSARSAVTLGWRVWIAAGWLSNYPISQRLISIYNGIPNNKFIGKVKARGKARYKLGFASGIALFMAAGAVIWPRFGGHENMWYKHQKRGTNEPKKDLYQRISDRSVKFS